MINLLMHILNLFFFWELKIVFSFSSFFFEREKLYYTYDDKTLMVPYSVMSLSCTRDKTVR